MKNIKITLVEKKNTRESKIELYLNNEKAPEKIYDILETIFPDFDFQVSGVSLLSSVLQGEGESEITMTPKNKQIKKVRKVIFRGHKGLSLSQKNDFVIEMIESISDLAKEIREGCFFSGMCEKHIEVHDL